MGWVKNTRNKLNRGSRIEMLFARELKLMEMYFIRNYPVQLKGRKTRFIDFYFPNSKLFVELDGKEHKRKQDKEREDFILKSHRDHRFMRFTNKQVLTDLNTVLKSIGCQPFWGENFLRDYYKLEPMDNFLWNEYMNIVAQA